MDKIVINNVPLPQFPNAFSVTVLDIDDGEASVRSADGTLTRDRIAVKRQIDMSWGVLNWSDTSMILKAMRNAFFDVYYPDPQDGHYSTRTFYVSNRPVPFTVAKDNNIMWGGLKVTLIER